MPGKETIEIEGAKTGMRSGLLSSTSNSTSAAMCQGNISEEEVGAQDGRSKDEVKVLSRKGKDEAAVVMNAKVRCPESPVNQANESPVDQAKEEIEYWLEVKRLLVDPSDEARDQLEKLMEKREERESVTQLRSENKMVASAKDSLAYMAIDIRGAVDDALLAVEDQQSLRLSRKCKTALDLAWKQYQTSHTLYVTKEKDEALEKDAFVQRRQHKKAFDAALAGLEEYIESLEGEPVEEGLADETALVLATLIEAKAEEKASVVEVEDEICAAKAEVVVKWAANKVDVESCADKDAKELLCRGEGDAGEAVEVVEEYADKVELGFCAAKDQLKLCAIKDELGKRRIGEVVVEECNSKMLLRSGDLDPGEGAGLGMEVKQSRLKVKQHLAGMVCGKFEVEEPRIAKDGLKFCATKDVEFEMQDVEFEVQRFVTAGCRAQGTNSEYG